MKRTSICVVILAISPVVKAEFATIQLLPSAPVQDIYGMNNSGVVIGTSGGGAGIVWVDGQYKALASDWRPSGINNAGKIVGWLGLQAVVWDTISSAPATILNTDPDLSSPSPIYSYLPSGVNDAGQFAIGTSYGFYVGTGHSVNEHGNGLSVPVGWSGATAAGIANNGRVFGMASPPGGGTSVAVTWSPTGQFQDISMTSFTYSVAANDHDQVLFNYSGNGAVSLWQNGVTNFIADRAKGADINNRGQVVGWGGPYNTTGFDGGFMWENGTFTNLLSLIGPGQGWDYLIPKAINDKGQIAGIGVRTADQRQYAFLLTPPPDKSLVRDSNFAGGSLVGWSTKGPGVADVVETAPGSGNYAARLTTGSPVDLTQYVDLPAGGSWINFQYEFVTPTGQLDVYIDNTLLGSITAPSVPGGAFAYGSFFVPSSLWNENSALLDFHYDGPTGSQVLLDNVSINSTSVVPLPAAAWGGLALLGGMVLHQMRPALSRRRRSILREL